MKTAIFLIVTLLTASCSIVPPKVPATIKERLPVGSILKLNQSVIIPKDRSFIYIANGKVAPLKNYNTVDIYSPYCMFYINNETSQSHTIMPDRFEITKITEWEGYKSHRSVYKYASVNTQPAGLIKTRLASRSLSIRGGMDITMYATILRLHSSKQPEVKEMVCGRWDDPTEVTHLTLDELKIALGDLMTIKVKEI